jgi:hypothetical protein
MTRAISRLRWVLYGGYILAAGIAMLMAFTPGLAVLGLPPERVTFIPASFTGLPWTLPVFVTKFDSVTALAIVMVGNLLNVAIGLMLARSGDD